MPGTDRNAELKFDAMPNYSSGVWRGRPDSQSEESLTALVSGSNRCKYFKQPLKHKRKLDNELKVFHIPPWLKSCLVQDAPLMVCTATQTDYRENDTQTDPWDVPYKATGEPEILTLKSLTYGKGLPVVKNRAVEDIERARERRTLEKQIQVCESENRRMDQFRLVVQLKLKEMAVNVSDLRSNQIEKLDKMKKSLEDEVRYRETRRIEMLERMWGTKKEALANKSEKLYEQFDRSVNILTKKRLALTRSEPPTANSVMKIVNPAIEAALQVDYPPMKRNDCGDSYYLSDPRGLVELERWMWEEQKLLMEPAITLPEIERLTKSFQKDYIYTKKPRPLDIKTDFGVKSQKAPRQMPEIIPQAATYLPETVLSQEYSMIILQKLLRGRAMQKEIRAVHTNYADLIYEQRKTKPWTEEKQLEAEKQKKQKHLEYMNNYYTELKVKKDKCTTQLSRNNGFIIASELICLGRAEDRLTSLNAIRPFISTAKDVRRHREAEEAGRRQQELIFREILSYICNEVAEVQEAIMDDFLNDVMLNE